MPKVQENAIEAAAADAEPSETTEIPAPAPKPPVAPNAASNGQPVDKNGATFDAGLHEVDADGKPRLSEKGMLRLKRGGGAAGRRVLGVNKPGAAAPAAPVSNDPTPQTVAAAQGMAIITVTAGQIIGGEEFAPMRKEIQPGIVIDDMQSLTGAFTTYFHAKGISDLPPGVVLAAALMGYIAPRFAMPKTQSRFARLKGWVAGKWAKWKYGKDPKRVTEKTERAKPPEMVGNDNT